MSLRTDIEHQILTNDFVKLIVSQFRGRRVMGFEIGL